MTINQKTEYKKYISSTVDFHNFEHAVEIADELGLGIEISRFGKLSELDEKFDETLKNYKAILNGFKGEVSLHGFFSNLAIASKDSAIKQISIKRYYQSLEIAQSLGAKSIVFHTLKNNLLKHKEFNKIYFQQSVEFYNQFIKECENSNITVALENVHESDPEYIRDTIAIINSNNFKACLDIGHCNLHSNLSPSEWIKTYGIMLYHMHVHNNFKDEDSHSSLLKGDIDLIQTFKTIKELNIKPSITFEIFDENALRESVDYFKNNIETL